MASDYWVPHPPPGQAGPPHTGQGSGCSGPKICLTHINVGGETPEQMLGIVTLQGQETGDRDDYPCQALSDARTADPPK